MTATASVTFEAFRDEWLADIREGNPSTSELGHRFARKMLTQWREIEDSSDDLVYCDGAGDGGIDIAYLDRGDTGGDDDVETVSGHTWYLVQSKYGSAFQGIPTLLEEGQKVVDALDGKRHRLSSLAEGLIDRLHTFMKQASDRDRIVLVFATEEPLTEEQKMALGDIRAIARERLSSIFDLEAVSIETIYQRSCEDNGSLIDARIRVPLEGDFTDSGEGLLVGTVSVLHLYRFLKSYRDQTEDLDRLYEKNVRRFLGSRGKINRAIQQTLRDTPERFGLYNNGITIVVTDFESNGKAVGLVDPYIVNGCQTTRTIWEVCHQRLEAGGTSTDPGIEEWRRLASRGVAITKIVKVGDDGEQLLQDITRYTNSQNAVREKDFLALTSDFRTWTREMAARYNVFLEIQRGAWDSQRAYQKQNPSTTQFTEHANAFDLLKVYGAGWLREPGTAFGRNAAFLPNGAIFRRIMDDDTNDDPFGVDDLYAAYRVQGVADSYGFGRGAAKESRRQTRQLFYTVALDVLKHLAVLANLTTTRKELTRCLLWLFGAGNEEAREAIFNTAVQIIDAYLTSGTGRSIYDEPAFKNTFNSDLNGFLKWEKLAKYEDSSPRYHTLLATYEAALGLNSPALLDQITGAIRE